MSKKAEKKLKVKVPEVDQDSPEWQEEVARKQKEAYDMIQRAIIRSQVDVMLTTKDNLLRQKADIEAKTEQQSQDQNDIYQYLRGKLKDNYVAIAELEAKVSQAHEERQQREKELIEKTKYLDEKRKTEKVRLLEQLQSLEVELAALKDFQENSATHDQKLKDLESSIAESKEAFLEEVAMLTTQVEEEWDLRCKEKEEMIKITKKAAAKATQEQLGPRTKHKIGQNKKMMSELRFQCYEVEKMQSSQQGLIESNTLLLAQAASARHSVEEMARRSHLLQRIIRYMHDKLQSRRNELRSARGGLLAGVSVRTAPTSEKKSEGGRAEGVGTQYKMAGMSEEERQQMLDLREELRQEEVGIAVTQDLLAVTKGKLREEDEERARAATLKADLARVLARSHEDPLLSTNNTISSAKPITPVKGAARAIEDGIGGSASDAETKPPQHHGCSPRFPAISLGTCPSTKQQEEQNAVTKASTRGRPRRKPGHESILKTHNPHETVAGDVYTRSSDQSSGHRYVNRQRQDAGATSGGTLPVWPESTPLPVATVVESTVGDRGETIWDGQEEAPCDSRYLTAGVLKAVSRLFLAKLHISVEPITPRHLDFPEVMSLPALAGITTVGKNSTNKTDPTLSSAGPFGGGEDVQGRGSTGAGITEDHSVYRRGTGEEADDLLSMWSDRLTTGIASWDMLETAVRQTKRRRTRDAACQTLTFRELRDGKSNSASRGDYSVQKQTNHGDGHYGQRHQHQNQQQHRQQSHYLLQSLRPTTQSRPRRKPPALTVSKCKTTRNDPQGGGGKLRAARGGTKGGVRHKQIRQDEGSRAVNADPVVGLHDVETRQTRERSHKGAAPRGPEFTPQSHLYGRLDDITKRTNPQPPNSAHPPGSSLGRPQSFHLRTSSPLRYVSVSWGDERRDDGSMQALLNLPTDVSDSHNNGGQMVDGNIGTGITRPSVDVRERRTGGRGGGGAGGGPGYSEEEERTLWLDSTCNTSEGACRGNAGGNPYEPLSKGSDYRKVLLFTVDDNDKHMTYRVHPKRTAVAASTTTLSSDVGGRNHHTHSAAGSAVLLSEHEVKTLQNI